MKADLVAVNAKIFTACGGHLWADSLAVWRNRFAAVGERAEIEPLIGPDTELLDAQGKVILPGLNDGHCHMASVGAEHALQVDCTPEKCRSIDQIVAAFRQAASDIPPGEWIVGFGYDETKLKEDRHPTRWELDRATDRHPILLKSFTYHFGVVNSKALETAGLDRSTPDPSGGVFERSSEGELNGVCFEEAFFMWLPGFSKGEPLIPAYSAEKKAQGLALICEEFNRMGITSVGDASSDIHTLQACQSTDLRGALTVRVNMMIHERNFPLLRDAGIRTGFGNSRYKVGSIKSFADGACAGRTAWLTTPYGDKPDYRGISVKSPEEMDAAVEQYHSAGFQISVHANGDAAITMVLDAYEKALNAQPRENHRHRIEHCTFVTEQILQRMKRLGVAAAPFANYIVTQGDKLDVYGEWIHTMFAHRSFLDYGIPVGGSTDFPVVTANPLISLQSMVTRKYGDGRVLGAKQKVSLEEAITIYTLGSAYLSFEEQEKGSIETGKLADFVILDQDPFSIPPEEIGSIGIDRTVFDGRTVYRKE
jgi:predicted amidohydrolase YtcJ